MAVLVVVTSLIGIAMLLLLTGLIPPTAIVASAAPLNGVTGVDDTLQRSSENDDINTSDGSPIELGIWYEFRFFKAGSFATGCAVTLDCVESPGTPAIEAENPPWTFEAPAGGAELKVTDVANSGDRFEVFDFGESIGTTSSSASGDFCGYDPVPCFSDPIMNHGTFGLDAGPHSITIKAIQSVTGNGAAYFRVDPTATTVLTADIDIKPGDGDRVSTINTKSRGTTTVAILGNEEFGDVSQVDISSIEFAGTSPSSTRLRIEDVNGDGTADLILKFNTQAMDELQVGDTEACLVGELNDGTLFEGCDEVRVI